MFEYINNEDSNGLLDAIKAIKSKVDCRAALKQKDPQGNTLLHAAIIKGNLEIVKTLLLFGVAVNDVDVDGKSALALAIEHIRPDIVQELVAFDVDLKSVDKNGQTPLNLVESAALNHPNEQDYSRLLALLRTRQAWQEEAAGFRFNRVVQLIKEAYPKIEPARDRDKVLFIGGTGVGKSTLLNYLNGVKYSVARSAAGDISVEVVAGQELALTGNGLISTTLYPQVIAKDGLPFVYCDLAGMSDSRGLEEQICAANSVHVLSKLPGDIKNIVVVLDIPGFQADRGHSFKKTAVALANMVKNNSKLLDAMTFVITKQPLNCKITVDAIIAENVSDLLADYENKNDDPSEGLSADEEALVFMFSEIKKRPKQIFIPDITDNGQSRQIIENVLKQAEAKPASAFDFLDYEGSQKAFSDVLISIATWYVESNNQLKIRVPGLIKIETDLQADINAEIVELNQLVADKNTEIGKSFDAAVVNGEIVSKNAKIVEKNNKIATNHASIKILRDQITALQIKLGGIDVDDLVYVDDVVPSIVNKPTSLKVTYTSKAPLCQISYHDMLWYGSCSTVLEKPKYLGNRYFAFDNDAKNGIYEELFQASGGIERLKVEFKTRKKYLHKAEILRLKESVSDKQKEIATFEKNNITLNGEINNLNEEINACKIDKMRGQANAANRDERLKAEVISHQESLQAANIKLDVSKADQQQLEKVLQNIQIELEVNQDLLNIVFKVSCDLDLVKNSYIRNFCELWVVHNPQLQTQLQEMLKREEINEQRAKNASAVNQAILSGFKSAGTASGNKDVVGNDHKVANNVPKARNF